MQSYTKKTILWLECEKKGSCPDGWTGLACGVKEDEKRDCAGAAKAIKWLKVRYEQKRKI